MWLQDKDVNINVVTSKLQHPDEINMRYIIPPTFIILSVTSLLPFSELQRIFATSTWLRAKLWNPITEDGKEVQLKEHETKKKTNKEGKKGKEPTKKIEKAKEGPGYFQREVIMPERELNRFGRPGYIYLSLIYSETALTL